MSKVIEHEIYRFRVYIGTELQLGYLDPVEGYVDHNGVRSEWVDKLENAIIPSEVDKKKVINLAYKSFRQLPNLKTVFIPNTIKTIAADTFFNCYKLTSVTFEENSQLEQLSGYSFCSTNISSIIFPSTLVTTGGDALFYNCSNLHTVVIQSFLSTNSTTTFTASPSTISILVPENYPFDTFGKREVIKALPRYPSIKVIHTQNIHFIFQFHVFCILFCITFFTS